MLAQLDRRCKRSGLNVFNRRSTAFISTEELAFLVQLMAEAQQTPQMLLIDELGDAQVIPAAHHPDPINDSRGVGIYEADAVIEDVVADIAWQLDRLQPGVAA